MIKLTKVSVSIKLLFTILIAYFAIDLMSPTIRSLSYGISLTIKEFLMLLLPFIIASSIFISIANIKNLSFKILILLVVVICVSNFSNVLISGVFTKYFVITNQTTFQPIAISNSLEPIGNIQIPRIIKNEYALLVGFILGMFSTFREVKKVEHLMYNMYNCSMWVLNKIFIPLLPFFIFGLMIKLLNDDLITSILKANFKFIVAMLILIISYLSLICMIVAKFNFKKLFVIIRNAFPPVLTAFTTMSSAAALPFSLKAAEHNTGSKEIADLFIPATVNIHMVGDSLCIPILALMLMQSFGMPAPDTATYLYFAFIFMVTKFSGAGVPGGTILVMIPVLEKVFGFTPEMVGLITTMYILIDPITTSSNVLGNNIIVILFKKLVDRLFKFSKEVDAVGVTSLQYKSR